MPGGARRRERIAKDMGVNSQIANQDARQLWRYRADSCASAFFSSAEQRISSGAVGGGLFTMRFNADYLRFEQRDPIIEFGLRIRAEIFTCEVARCIASGPRQIRVFHHHAASQGNRLAVNPRERYAPG